MQAISFQRAGMEEEGNAGQVLPPLSPNLIPWTVHQNFETPPLKASLSS